MPRSLAPPLTGSATVVPHRNPACAFSPSFLVLALVFFPLPSLSAFLLGPLFRVFHRLRIITSHPPFPPPTSYQSSPESQSSSSPSPVHQPPERGEPDRFPDRQEFPFDPDGRKQQLFSSTTLGTDSSDALRVTTLQWRLFRSPVGGATFMALS